MFFQGKIIFHFSNVAKECPYEQSSISPILEPEADLGLLEAVNYYHKALHLGCCSSPRSASESRYYSTKTESYYRVYHLLAL